MSAKGPDLPPCTDGLMCWIGQHEALGVWVGSAASFVVACVAVGVVFLQRHFEEKASAKDELSRRQSLGFSMLMKLNEIHSNLGVRAKAVEKMYSEGKQLGLTEPWQFVTPLGFLSDRIRFSTDETKVLFELGDHDLFNRVTIIDQQHNSALALQEFYSARRIALTDMLPAKLRGAVGQIVLPAAANDLVAPRAQELNALAGSMKEFWSVDAAEAEALLMRLKDRLKSGLGLNVPLGPVPKVDEPQ